MAVLSAVALILALPTSATAQEKASSAAQPDTKHSAWKDYGGASDSAQYSALTEINRANVGKLRVVWRLSHRRQQQISLQSHHRRPDDVRAGS